MGVGRERRKGMKSLIYSESSSPRVNFVSLASYQQISHLSNEGQGRWDNACDPLAKCLAEFRAHGRG